MVFSIAGITPSVQAQDNPSTPVFVDAVREEPLSQTMPVIGRLVATQSGVVAARTTGPLGEFRVQVGDRVKKDDVVAVLIKDALESRRELWLAQVAQAKSRVGTSKAQLQLRDQELKRLKSLESSSAFSQAKLDDKQQEVAVMKSTIAEHRAALDVAKANLMLADIDLYNADIRAPYDSVIAVRHTNVGSFVRAGDPVITLIDDTTLEIAADVPTERIPGLTKGVSVNYVLTDNSKTGVATGWASVRAIIPDENPLTRTRSVRFSAELDQGSILAANQSVTVMIPIGAPRDVISVHKDAIINKGGNTLVYIALDGKAVIRPVKLGDAVDGRFEILNGLKIGDLVVVRGNERLRPDQAITFTSPDTAG
ncbi:MAG: efflux RND transporter periplasmic adaptor subunit [Rhodospirillales bacterium]|nr:efflux RND transporter periplasmic adaptor subunit [Rhodospirillales bacterium]